MLRCIIFMKQMLLGFPNLTLSNKLIGYFSHSQQITQKFALQKTKINCRRGGQCSVRFQIFSASRERVTGCSKEQKSTHETYVFTFITKACTYYILTKLINKKNTQSGTVYIFTWYFMIESCCATNYSGKKNKNHKFFWNNAQFLGG